MVEKTTEKSAAAVQTKPKAEASYLAPGTVFEGNIRSAGDVEIAGEFKGNIVTEGAVILHSSIQGNITAKSLKLSSCSLNGDVVVNEAVAVGQHSQIMGNVTAKDLVCAGRITGDLSISENMTLEKTADPGPGQEFEQSDPSSEPTGNAPTGKPEDTQSKPQLKPEQILKPEQSIDGEPDGDNDTNSEPVQQNAQRTPYKTIILIMLCSAGVSALVTALLVEKKKKRQP